MSKTEQATEFMAKELLSYKKGDKIKTFDEYCTLIPFSRGIIQRAMKVLEDNNAIYLIAKGQTGTFIEKINYTKLLKLTNIKHILGSMPLPYTQLYEGLASSIILILSKYIRTSFAYTRGALTRLERTEDKIYDFAIVSEEAITQYLSTNKNSKLEVIKNFGDNSYTYKHMIIHNKDCLQKEEIIVGVDESSQDHKLLVEKLSQQENFNNKKIIQHPINSYKVIDLVTNGIIDATIWSKKDNLISTIDKDKVTFQELDYDLSFSRAVLVVHKNNTAIKSILNRVINTSKVVQYQQQVVENEIIPQY